MAGDSSNKTIAKNTIYLYIRSFLMMAVSLFSSRVVLQALGIEDYGLYGAIGSFVAMFTIMNGVLAAGTSRFLTFELGKGDNENLRKTFSASFTMHCALAVVLFILLETLGVWFLNNKMSIPEGREFAANIVFQLSIVTSMLSLTQVPYSASIIAHEKMSVYAYVGILEVVFKLALVLILLYIPFTDNLIGYAIILTIWGIGLQIWYRYYCRKRFEEANLMVVRDKNIYKGMLSYSLWDIVGQFCATGNSQGLNILLNMFFGVSVNAARSVAYQVENAITVFSSNFMTSVQPQIVKSYARGDYDRFFQLIYEGGKYSFFLLFIISLPIFLEANYILSLWLVDVPPMSVLFLRCVIVITLLRVPSQTIIRGVHATGKVKILNLTSGVYSASTFLPVIYISYKMGLPVWMCFVVQAFNSLIVCTYLEMRALKINIDYNIWSYYKDVYFKSLGVCMLAIIPSVFPLILMEEGLIRLILTGTISVISTAVVVYYFGLSYEMREKILGIVKNKFLRLTTR